MSLNPHSAPIPSGLAEAAGIASAVGEDDVRQQLAALSPDKWLSVIMKWVKVDPVTRKTKTAAGPVWWFAIHSVALNPNPASSPLRFVGQWLGHFPCRKCRMDARTYVAKHPVPGWDGFAAWASTFHDHVTSKKKP